MELKLERFKLYPNSTIGKLYIDGRLHSNTIEDTDRGLKQSDPLAYIITNKKHGTTAIPKGRYEVIVTLSNRFKRKLPLLVDVPGFEGIRIHPGNWSKDTEGCILPGTWTENSGEYVSGSKVSFDKLFDKITAALATGKVYINIV